jgi:uncharacterized coiled-coil protein SlyX
MADDLSPKEQIGVLGLLNSELGKAVGLGSLIVGFVYSVIVPINEIKTELRFINENHLKHIEKNIEDINDRDAEQDKRIADMCSRLDTLIGKFQVNK